MGGAVALEGEGADEAAGLVGGDDAGGLLGVGADEDQVGVAPGEGGLAGAAAAAGAVGRRGPGGEEAERGLLQTIRSRCQRIRFRPVPPAELRPWLEERGADPDLADRAQGSPGLALQLAESGPPGLDLLDGLARLPGQPIHQLFAYTESLGKKAEGGGEKTALIVDLVEELLRDTVLVAHQRQDATLHRDRLPLLDAWAAALYPGGVGRMQEALGDARERLRLNVNGRVVLEALLSRLVQELSR